MSFTSTMNLSRVLKTRLFVVPANGTVTVTADGRMDRPANCPVSSYSIELEKTGIAFDSSYGTKAFPATGARHNESWHNLPPGKYYLIISIGNDNPNCRLVGAVTVAT